MKRLLFISLMVFTSARLIAQESIGIGVSNYAPANSLLLNPSSIVDSKAFVDVHLLGVSAFVRNNLVFFPGNEVSLLQPSSFSGVDPQYNLGAGQYRAYTDLLVQGPTITATIGRHSFGLYTGFRTMADVRGIGNRSAQYVINGFQYGPYIGQETRVRNMRLTTLAWAEAGLSYGTILHQRGNDLLTGGLHVKRLFGVSGAAVRLNDWHFLVADSNTIETFSLRGAYGANEPGWNAGSGWGIDLGITYKKTLQGVSNYEPHLSRGGCKTCDYKYKLSAALLDIGRINFDPEFYTGNISADEGETWEDFDGENPDGVNDVAQLIDDNFGALDQDARDRMRVWLPGALSVQVDYNLGYNFYLNGSLILGAPWRNSFGVQRAALFSATPRFETKRFELALPVSLHELRDPMIGAMVRLNSIIIGTDNLGAYLLDSDLYGADIYVHIKYTIFRAWGCRNQKNKVRRSKSGGRVVPCASW